ncbi:MAG: hypothetical protein K2X04_09410 [Burkholderiales bacterium]|nr:hypothetical protein [Burkholderiales bacterium]
MCVVFSFLRTTNTGEFSVQLSNGSNVVTSDMIGVSKVNGTGLSGIYVTLYCGLLNFA